MLQRPKTPSLVPENDVTVHLVLDSFDNGVFVYREADEDQADLATVVDEILSGQYNEPYRIIAFNVAKGWSRDVTKDVAREVRGRAFRDDIPLRGVARDFVERVTGETV
jgi:hypothetical protein